MSISDELQKLAEMLQQGLLTEAEYETAKQRLLGAAPPDPSPSSESDVAVNEGRLFLGVGSAAMLVSLFLPWISLFVVELNAFDLVRLVFEANRGLGALRAVFGDSVPSIPGITAVTLVMVVAVLANLLAPLRASAPSRYRQALAGAGTVLVVWFLVIAGFVENLTSIGVVVFLVAAASNALVAGSQLGRAGLLKFRFRPQLILGLLAVLLALSIFQRLIAGLGDALSLVIWLLIGGVTYWSIRRREGRATGSGGSGVSLLLDGLVVIAALAFLGVLDSALQSAPDLVLAVLSLVRVVALIGGIYILVQRHRHRNRSIGTAPAPAAEER